MMLNTALIEKRLDEVKELLEDYRVKANAFTECDHIKAKKIEEQMQDTVKAIDRILSDVSHLSSRCLYHYQNR